MFVVDFYVFMQHYPFDVILCFPAVWSPKNPLQGEKRQSILAKLQSEFVCVKNDSANQSSFAEPMFVTVY